MFVRFVKLKNEAVRDPVSCSSVATLGYAVDGQTLKVNKFITCFVISHKYLR